MPLNFVEEKVKFYREWEMYVQTEDKLALMGIFLGIAEKTLKVIIALVRIKYR